MKMTNLKQLPHLNADEDSEAFLEQADLSEYVWSGARRIQLRLRPAPDTEDIRLSLQAEVALKLRKSADFPGLPYTRHITRILEQAAQ